MPEIKVASTGDRTHNHQVMSPTRLPLSHPGGSLAVGMALNPNTTNQSLSAIIPVAREGTCNQLFVFCQNVLCPFTKKFQSLKCSQFVIWNVFTKCGAELQITGAMAF